MLYVLVEAARLSEQEHLSLQGIEQEKAYTTFSFCPLSKNQANLWLIAGA
jgi:hypothetical protein